MGQIGPYGLNDDGIWLANSEVYDFVQNDLARITLILAEFMIMEFD